MILHTYLPFQGAIDLPFQGETDTVIPVSPTSPPQVLPNIPYYPGSALKACIYCGPENLTGPKNLTVLNSCNLSCNGTSGEDIKCSCTSK